MGLPQLVHGVEQGDQRRHPLLRRGRQSIFDFEERQLFLTHAQPQFLLPHERHYTPTSGPTIPRRNGEWKRIGRGATSQKDGPRAGRDAREPALHSDQRAVEEKVERRQAVARADRDADRELVQEARAEEGGEERGGVARDAAHVWGKVLADFTAEAKKKVRGKK